MAHKAQETFLVKRENGKADERGENCANNFTFLYILLNFFLLFFLYQLFLSQL